MITHIKQEFQHDILEDDTKRETQNAILNQIFDTDTHQEKNQDNSSILKNLITSDHASLQLIEQHVPNVQTSTVAALNLPSSELENANIQIPNVILTPNLSTNNIPGIVDSTNNIIVSKDKQNKPGEINLFSDKKFTFHNIDIPTQYGGLNGQFKYDNNYHSDQKQIKPPRIRLNYSQMEEQNLIKIWQQISIREQLQKVQFSLGMSFLVELVTLHRQFGYDRTTEQVKNWCKNMKNKYIKTVEHNNEFPTMPKTCRYYNILENIFRSSHYVKPLKPLNTGGVGGGGISNDSTRLLGDRRVHAAVNGDARGNHNNIVNNNNGVKYASVSGIHQPVRKFTSMCSTSDLHENRRHQFHHHRQENRHHQQSQQNMRNQLISQKLQHHQQPHGIVDTGVSNALHASQSSCAISAPSTSSSLRDSSGGVGGGVSRKRSASDDQTSFLDDEEARRIREIQQLESRLTDSGTTQLNDNPSLLAGQLTTNQGLGGDMTESNHLEDDDDFDVQFADETKIFDVCASDDDEEDNSMMQEEIGQSGIHCNGDMLARGRRIGGHREDCEHRHQQIIQLHTQILDTMKTQHTEIMHLFKQFLDKR